MTFSYAPRTVFHETLVIFNKESSNLLLNMFNACLVKASKKGRHFSFKKNAGGASEDRFHEQIQFKLQLFSFHNANALKEKLTN